MATPRKTRNPRSTPPGKTSRRAVKYVDQSEPVAILASPGAAGPALRLRTGALESMKFYQEWLRIMLGSSDRAIPDRDNRFADSTWRANPLYRRLAQSYLAFCDAIDAVAGTHPDWRKRERNKFLAGILTSALSPTNTLLGNPAAIKHAIATRGLSLLRGARNMATDLVRNKGMPSQIKPGTFRVGENVAVTSGAVVFRNEMVEVLQYQPTTSKVRRIPTLMITPPIGKYYFMDLAPNRSFTEFAVAHGTRFFTVSWRNPQPEHGHWGLDDYVKSALEAVDAVCEITGSDKINILGLCAGGIIATLMMSYMVQSGDKRVNCATFGVMLLDFDVEAPIGGFRSKAMMSLARRRSSSKGILPASNLSSVFAWMRPNDLVWNYWVNDYLLGKDPPPFDILGWSVDATNLPAKLHGEFLDMFQHNTIVEPGALEVLDKPVNLKAIKVDTLVTGAIADHLTPWAACYRTTQLLGGKSTFLLSNAGHIASLVNPPGNAKATYYAGAKPGPDPEAWRQGATRHAGTWWEVWADWLATRSGALMTAPAMLGSKHYPELGPAPGEYVRQPA